MRFKYLNYKQPKVSYEALVELKNEIISTLPSLAILGIVFWYTYNFGHVL